jgi:hypothetical protein
MKTHDDFLVRAMNQRRAESLLVSWVNIPDRESPDVPKAIDRLVRLYPEVFTWLQPRVAAPEVDTLVLEVRYLLKAAWETSDRRASDWYLYKIRDQYHFGTTILQEDMAAFERGERKKFTWESWWKEQQPPTQTPFEQAMFHLHRNLDRARRCANPECPAPFFLTRKKGQRYCGSKCSGEAQREQRRRWWRDNRGKDS